MTEAIEAWERKWRNVRESRDEAAMASADANRSELTTERDKLIVFSEGLAKFVRSYEYVVELVDFGDPVLEGFSSFARLLRKRLKGLTLEQVDLSDLALTHFKIKERGKLSGLTPDGKFPTLEPITNNALREARDRASAPARNFSADVGRRARAVGAIAAWRVRYHCCLCHLQGVEPHGDGCR